MTTEYSPIKRRCWPEPALNEDARRTLPSSQLARCSPAKTTLFAGEFRHPALGALAEVAAGNFGQTKNSGLVAPQPAKRGVFGKHYRPACRGASAKLAPVRSDPRIGTECNTHARNAVLQKNRTAIARALASGRFIIIFNVLHRHSGRYAGARRDRRDAGVVRARMPRQMAL